MVKEVKLQNLMIFV